MKKPVVVIRGDGFHVRKHFVKYGHYYQSIDAQSGASVNYPSVDAVKNSIAGREVLEVSGKEFEGIPIKEVKPDVGDDPG